jgi:hypothetical protein
MSAQEFGEWMVFFEREQLHPAADLFRHAQLIAAAHNGPLSRTDKQLWQTSHLLAADAWAPAEPEPAPPSLQTLAAQVAAINARFEP